ncbi:MAG: SPOR domain-containing protein [Mariprofundaceae bacterium]
MSDNNDQKTDKIKITPSMDLSDMDSTIRLDLGGNQNVVSTSPPGQVTSNEFDKTIDGLTDIEEMLDNESSPDTTDEEETLSSDEIDFGDLDAGIDALSKDLLEPGSEIDEMKTVFNIEESSDSDLSDSDNEFLLSSSDNISMSTDENKEDPLTETDPLLDTVDDIELDENEAIEESKEIEEISPVIELTEEMLDEPEQPLLPELDDLQDSNEENSGDEELDSIVETPELTTTETNVLAGATAAIKEITEEEKENAVQEPTVVSEIPTPVEHSNSSNSLPVFMGIMGIVAGGFGAWTAYDASNRVADLERQIQSLTPAAQSEQTQNIANIQQRLTKIERRLTGTPTVDAAAPLGSTTSKPEKIMTETKAVVNVITPQTKVVETAAKAGDWVINLSSHVKESLAKREQAHMQTIGVDTQIHTALIKNRTWYRVQVTGLANKGEAKSKLRDIQQKTGIKGAWVGKR